MTHVLISVCLVIWGIASVLLLRKAAEEATVKTTGLTRDEVAGLFAADLAKIPRQA